MNKWTAGTGLEGFFKKRKREGTRSWRGRGKRDGCSRSWEWILELLGRGVVDEYDKNTLYACMKFSNNKNVF